MSENKKNYPVDMHSDKNVISSEGRGGPWLPIVLCAIGVGIVLSGIFSGAVGLYGDTGKVTWSDGFIETGREVFRLIIFSLLFLIALRIYGWRMQRPLGSALITALRCLAIVALIEAVRVSQIQHGIIRILLISAAQYVVCCIGVLALFSISIRETVLFVSWCTVGVALLWVGAHTGTWIS